MRCILVVLLFGLTLVPFALGCGGSTTTPPPPPGPDTRTAYFTTNWGDDSIRRTDAIDQMADGTTATPATIAGAATLLDDPDTDAVYADATNERLYVTGYLTTPPGDGAIFVFDNALSAQGDIAPNRIIEFSPAASQVSGIELDEARDRLYVYANIGPSYFLQVFENASTLDGLAPADLTLLISGLSTSADLFLDTLNDRLYMTFVGRIEVFDNASTLTIASTPARTIMFTTGTPYGAWVDPYRDRLYVACRTASSAGNNVFVFAGASVLNGTFNPDTTSTARFPFSNAMIVMVDAADRLYVMRDSATSVSIYENAGDLFSDVTATPRVINGVVDRGYGKAVLHYDAP